MHRARDQFIRSGELQVVGDTGNWFPNIIILKSWMRNTLPLPPKRRLSIARNTLMAPYGMRELFWAARALPPPLQI